GGGRADTQGSAAARPARPIRPLPARRDPRLARQPRRPAPAANAPRKADAGAVVTVKADERKSTCLIADVEQPSATMLRSSQSNRDKRTSVHARTGTAAQQAGGASTTIPR